MGTSLALPKRRALPEATSDPGRAVSPMSPFCHSPPP